MLRKEYRGNAERWTTAAIERGYFTHVEPEPSAVVETPPAVVETPPAVEEKIVEPIEASPNSEVVTEVSKSDIKLVENSQPANESKPNPEIN